MITLSFVEATLAMMVRLSTPYLYAGIGGLISQKSGVYNFALEGMMLGGAYFGYFFALITGNLFLGFLGAVVFGFLSGWLLAFIAIRFGVSQLVICLGMNTLYMGITSFCSRLMNNANMSLPLDHLIPNINMGVLSSIPVIGPMLLNQNILTYAVIAIFVLYAWFIKRTEYGLSLRAVGENPAAAQTAGINVFRYRYIAVILSGVLSSLGGAFLTLTQVNRFAEGMTGGRGWIAIAAICLGRWSPAGTFFSCLLFGLATAVSNQIQVLNLGIPYQVALMVPYILSMVALVSIRGKLVHGPAALGKPYMKNR
jgi:simple sugar transport system permease protein